MFGAYIITQDNNPHHISVLQHGYQIMNKYDNILWETETKDDLFNIPPKLRELDYRIVDYNKDGENEVLISYGFNRSLNLFNSTGKKIWTYRFSYDSLATSDELFENNYQQVKIIGLAQNGNMKTIVGFTQHSPYYPTAIVQIDLITGKQNENIFWHAGGIIYGELHDFNNDGYPEVIASAIHNRLRRAVLFSIDLVNLSGQSPSVYNYTFKNIGLAKFNHYILLPTPDYFALHFQKYFIPSQFSIRAKGQIAVSVVELANRTSKINISIRFDKDFSPKGIIIKDKYAIERDKLVEQGILDYPLSDTDEYREILMNQLEYWDGTEVKKFNHDFTK